MRRLSIPFRLSFWLPCLLGFALVSGGMERFARAPFQGPQLGPKLEVLDDRWAQVDVIFLGSSQIANHLDPEIFDAELARRGHSLTSFNLGLSGMRPVEAEQILRTLTGLEPRRERWVLIDVEPDATRLHQENALARRVISWHDAAAVWRVLGLLWQTEELPWSKRLERAQAHLKAMVRHYSGLGRLAESPQFGFDYYTPSLGPAGNGFVPMEWALSFEPPERASDFRSLQARRKKLVDDPDQLRRRARAIVEGEAVAGIEKGSDVAAVGQLMETARRHGWKPVLILGPRKQLTEQVTMAVDRGELGPTLRFNDPQDFPWLFDPDLRFDLSHLNAEGAQRYTELVAETFAEELLAAP
ncbi:MAG: hypothetical protein AAGD01_04290 [Acidobacteriota bacterium]